MNLLYENAKRINVVVGHYGSGKTNFCVNLALYLASKGKKVAVVDLDIVNPYFRSADFKELFEKNDIKVSFPQFANTNLDVPSLNPSVDAFINDEDYHVIIDVGGDDAGAIALGRYANNIANKDYDCFYVVNICRYLTHTADEMLEYMKDIEQVSKLKCTKIVNNSNLGEETTKDIILNSIDTINEFSYMTKLDVVCTSVIEGIDVDINNKFNVRNYIHAFD